MRSPLRATNLFLIVLAVICTAVAAHAQVWPGPRYAIVDGQNSSTYGTGNPFPVAIVSGGGSGGTASTFSAAFPAIGTAIGAKNGVNMVNLTADTSSNLNVNCVVGCSSLGSLTPVVSTSAESSHVFKAAPGNLVDAYVTVSSTAGFLMLFNLVSAPTDGAVTPQDCIQVPANTTQSIFTGGAPSESFSTGITAVFSTTGCTTKTASATAFFHGRVQ